jgi:hypothetical protein
MDKDDGDGLTGERNPSNDDEGLQTDAAAR